MTHRARADHWSEAAALSRVAGELYADVPPPRRTLQSLRPFICSFDDVFEQVPHGADVLDIGCGSGLSLALLAKLGRIGRGHGYDVDSSAIGAARQAARRLPDPGQLTFETRPADAGLPGVGWTTAIVIDVIHHVPPAAQGRFVRDIAARVPAGGRLIVKDMVDAPAWRAAGNMLHDLVLARQRVHHVARSQVVEWANAEGLRTLHLGARNILWYGHWLAVFDRPNAYAPRPAVHGSGRPGSTVECTKKKLLM